MTTFSLRRRRARLLAACHQGTTLVEFGFVAPILMLMLVGILDLGYAAYVKAQLHGVVQKAARDSTLQTGTSAAAAAALDAGVVARIQQFGSNISAPTFKRRYFRNYIAAAAKQHEPFNDTDRNGRCDNGESYTDTNWNSRWDPDGGDAGGGGAQDRAVYTVTVTYPPAAPASRLHQRAGDGDDCVDDRAREPAF